MFRKAYALIESGALENNVRRIREKYTDYKYYFGVVKGDAYGHGMQSVKALKAGGINYFAVATLEEAVKLRQYDSEAPVLCLEPVSVEYAERAAELGVTLTVHRLDYLEALIAVAPCGTRVHLKLDTGMNRLGFKNALEVERAVELIRNSGNIMLEGIYTHLATSGLNDGYYDKQLSVFCRLTENIKLSEIPIVHIDRSLTLVHHKKPDFVNGTRLGICMYGFSQSVPAPTGLRALKRRLLLKGKGSEAIFSNELKLETAMSLYSEIIDIKDVKKGEFVGYGAKFIAESDMRAAVTAIGYYDGATAALGEVCVNGRRCPIIGESCMDMLQLSVSDEVQVGDMVELFGKDIPIAQAARKSGVSAYKLMTGISSRVPRVYEGKEYYL